MKKFLPYILIVLIVVQLFAPFTVGVGVKNGLEIQNNKAEAVDCEFVSAEYNPFTTIDENRVDETTLTVTTKNCVGKFFKGSIEKKAMFGTTMLDFGIQGVENDVLSFEIQVGERFCDYKDCQTVLDLYLYESSTGEQELDNYESTREIEKKDYLDFKCTFDPSGCTDARPWLILSSQGSSTWTITPSVTSDSLTVSGTGPTQGGSSDFTETDTLTVRLSKLDGSLVKEEVYVIKEKLLKDGVITYSTTFTGLQPQTGYNVKLTTKFGEVLNNGIYTLTASGQTYIPLPQDQKGQTTLGNSGDLPECVTGFLNIHVGGCFAQLLYYALFKPTSFVFGLTGKILDFTLFYSISDTSYRSSFVVEGWGIVRDFCNMFFIFVLLYIAFGTILKLNGVKTKEMIINVVIIGLLINFSLFTTQVIIDASNILTRVFYNQNTIVVGPPKLDAEGNPILDPNGKPVIDNKPGEFGEISLSEAIVSKVNPVTLITQSSKVGDATIRSGVDEGKETQEGITTGSFILVVLLATAVNVVGIIAFLSCAIIFISRVLGLWLAMILAPIAFFSYTVPALKDMKMIGWKHWWPDTLKMAFLAPVFAFFMYLIVGFMDKGLGIIDADSKTDLSFVVAIIVPFVFIMLLLMKAKSIAKDMSGEMGQKITNGIAAVGGMALGGAALGGAALGRKVIGGGLATASRTDSAKHFADQKIAHNKKLEDWEASGKKGPKPVFSAPKHGDILKNADGTNMKDKNGNDKTYNAVSGRLGGSLNEKQRKVGDIDYARHEEDEIKKAAGQVDAKGEVLDNSRISGEGEKLMENKFNQTKRTDAENAALKGVDAKGKDVLLTQTDEDGNVMTDASGNTVTHKGKEAFKSANRDAIADRVGKESTDNVDEKGKLTPTALKKVEDELNIKLNAAVKIAADKKLSDDFTHMRENAQKHVNVLTRGFAGANKASYDVRNLSEAKSDKREGMFSKIPVALVAAVAMGVRGGLKSVGTSQGSIKVEGNFMKDLGNTISDSLKGMKVNVDLGHIGETKSSADAHGGEARH